MPEFALDEPENLKGLIENHVGFVGLPQSISGPLKIEGTYAQGIFYVPLCTVEGTLSLSMTRGFYLTHRAGGIKTRHVKQELSRAPVFRFDEIEEAMAFLQTIDTRYDDIKKAAESTTRHGKLLRIDKHIIHNRVILDFIYHTAEAAGQNMVTLSTDAACRYIVENLSRCHESRRPTRFSGSACYHFRKTGTSGGRLEKPYYSSSTDARSRLVSIAIQSFLPFR
jgi:hydroxymethylglutaryl-CoA reductase